MNTTDINYLLDKKKIEILKNKFQSELDSLHIKYDNNENNINNINNNGDINRILLINKIIEKLKNEELILDNNKNSYYSEIDKLTYSKEWKHLKPIHRTIKIKEFLTNIIDDQQVRKDLINRFTDILYKGKLSSNKDVEYDKNKQCISSISVLLKNPDNTYTIKNI